MSKGISNYILATRQGRKLFDKAVKELINSGWLFAKKSTEEIHVSLNPHYNKEILDFIESQ